MGVGRAHPERPLNRDQIESGLEGLDTRLSIIEDAVAVLQEALGDEILAKLRRLREHITAVPDTGGVIPTREPQRDEDVGS